MIHKKDPRRLGGYNLAYSVWMPEKPDDDVDFLMMDMGHMREDISLVARGFETQGKPFEIMLPVAVMYGAPGTTATRPLIQNDLDRRRDRPGHPPAAHANHQGQGPRDLLRGAGLHSRTRLQGSAAAG